MSAPTWLLLTLDAAFPDLVGADRDRLAEQIITRTSVDLLATVIAAAAIPVLERYSIRDGAGDLSSEIGRAAAHVLVSIEEG